MRLQVLLVFYSSAPHGLRMLSSPAAQALLLQYSAVIYYHPGINVVAELTADALSTEKDGFEMTAFAT